MQLSTEIPLQLPVSTTLLKQSHDYVFHSNPQHLNLHAWCLGVDSSKNKASLWRWQRELLPLRGHQQGPSTSQSGPYLKMVLRKFSGFLHSICETNLRFFHVSVPRSNTPLPLMVTGLPLLTLWAQRTTKLHKVQTFTGYSPVFTGIVPKVPGIFQNGTFLLFSMSSQKRPLSL